MTQKCPLRDRLDRTLQKESYVLHVTRSSLRELETLFEQSDKEVFQQARQWGLDHADNILEEADFPQQSTNATNDVLGGPGKEILALIQSEPKYFVCSQDEALLDVLRSIGKTPLIRLSRGVLLLENPSKSSQNRASSQEKAKWSVKGSVQDHEKKLVDVVKDSQRRERRQAQRTQDEGMQYRSKGKAKGPNPLSCKKKRPVNANANSEPTRRTRRKKNTEEA